MDHASGRSNWRRKYAWPMVLGSLDVSGRFDVSDIFGCQLQVVYTKMCDMICKYAYITGIT